jgi:hypothetical protein
MYLTNRPSRFAFLYDVAGIQHRSDDAAGIYSEQTQTRSKRSPTPSWRKPDPSQWWHESRRQN